MRTYLTTLLTVFLLTIPAQSEAGQANEFRFKTYGMVCNQCAYGVEQSLQHSEGVNDAIVDLRSGSVLVKAELVGPPAVEVLAQRILDQRVSIEKVEATLVGRIERTTEGWLLVYGSQRYTLTPSDNSLLLDQHTGRTVVVDGFFEGIEGVDGATGTPRFILHTAKAA